MTDAPGREVFQALAASGPQGAPPLVEERLRAAFRRRARLRKMRVVWSAMAVAAAVAAVAFTTERPETPVPPPQAVAIAVRPPAFAWELRRTPPVQRAVSRRRPAQMVAAAVPQPADPDGGSGYYWLPQAREAPPLESATVVRVELPVSALADIGVPVPYGAGPAHIAADVVLGQDGIARAVRFLKQ